MQAKTIFGVVGAVVAVLYCGLLIYYFFDVGGSLQGVTMIGLGPTVLGLSVIGLLFCIPLILKLVRISGGPSSPGAGGRGGPDATTQESEGGFDADAVIARYMARQSSEAAAGPPASPSTHKVSRPAKQRGFGRRSR